VTHFDAKSAASGAVSGDAAIAVVDEAQVELAAGCGCGGGCASLLGVGAGSCRSGGRASGTAAIAVPALLRRPPAGEAVPMQLLPAFKAPLLFNTRGAVKARRGGKKTQRPTLPLPAATGATPDASIVGGGGGFVRTDERAWRCEPSWY
jgi:hypothetical protein